MNGREKWRAVSMCVYIHSGILFGHKKEILPFERTWMDLESIIFHKIIRERQKLYYFIYMWTSKSRLLKTFICFTSKKCNKQNSQIKRTDQWLPEVAGGGWEKWVKRIKSYKLPIIK